MCESWIRHFGDSIAQKTWRRQLERRACGFVVSAHSWGKQSVVPEHAITAYRTYCTWCRTVCHTRENFIKRRETRTNVTPINIILPQDARQLRVGHEGRGIA